MKEYSIWGDYDSALGEIVVDGSRKGFSTIFAANSKLNAHIIRLSNDDDVVRITLRCFSARNDGYTDYKNAIDNHNGSVFEHFEYYVETMKKFTDKIYLDTTLAQDFFAGQPQGHHWRRLKENNWAHLQNIFPKPAGREPLNFFTKSLYKSDTSKVVLAFTHMWDCYRKKQPGSELVIQICDDQDTYLALISIIFSQNKGIMPPGIKIEFIHYYHHLNDDGTEHIYLCNTLQQLTIDNTADNANDNIDFGIREASTKLYQLLNVSRSGRIRAYPYPQNLTLWNLAPYSARHQEDVVDIFSQSSPLLFSQFNAGNTAQPVMQQSTSASAAIIPTMKI